MPQPKIWTSELLPPNRVEEKNNKSKNDFDFDYDKENIVNHIIALKNIKFYQFFIIKRLTKS